MSVLKYLGIMVLTLLMTTHAYALQVAPSLGGTAVVQNQSRTFNSPVYKGYPVDICLTWGAGCGKPAADYFCRLSLGARAQSSSHAIAYDTPPTILPNTGQRCTEAFCDRFTRITCSMQTVVFRNPTVAGVGLDICLTWGAKCEKPAADSYCQRKGYRTSVGHKIAWDSPPSKLFSGQACNGAFCDRFTEISCQ